MKSSGILNAAGAILVVALLIWGFVSGSFAEFVNALAK